MGARLEKRDGGWAVILEAGRDSEGKRKRIVRRVKGTKKQAEQVKLQLMLEYGQGVEIGANKIAMADYLRSWLAGRRTNLKERTYESYEMHIEMHLIPALGHIPLGELSSAHIDAYKARKLKEPRRGQPKKPKEGEPKVEQKPLTPRTVDAQLATLNAALNRALTMRLISRNPLTGVERPKYESVKYQVLEPEQLLLFFETASKSSVYSVILLIAHTGMRLGEALGLEWRNVDLDQRTIYVRQQWQRTKEGLKMNPPKSKKGVRQIPLTDAAIALLEALRGSGSTYVFPGENGAPKDPSAVDKAFDRIRRTAGLPGLRLHDLRHSFATILLASGVSLPEVQAILGHEKASTTANIYGHTLPSRRNEIAAAFELTLQKAREQKKP